MSRTRRDVNFYLLTSELRTIWTCGNMFPKETRECTYGEINDIFELLTQQKVTVFTARMEFGKINTQYGETITKSISRLKEACAKCNLGVDPEYTSKTCRFTL
ncbi:hypothetical protein T02_3168 [Trichinella nativa]|uniref:Uncharacterized protein n=1 Tax=Trichinella nativa TaxID=6335 RepID=A0A0V1LAL4_9BILA|nr:hypothetical protein T02_3168 [Trichinella nativa]